MVHYSPANGTSVLYRMMYLLSPNMLLEVRPQKRVKLDDVVCSAWLCLLEVLSTLRLQYPYVMRLVGNDVSSNVSIFFACARTLCYDLLIILLTTDNSIHTLARCSILLVLEDVKSKFAFFSELFKITRTQQNVSPLRERHRSPRPTVDSMGPVYQSNVHAAGVAGDAGHRRPVS